jgi:hypothetical protein
MATSGQFNLPGADWIAFEGSPYPLGATITADSENYNFALLSNSASSVTLLLYTAQDLVNPVFQLIYDPRKNKSGPVWHARISLASTNGALYYAYSVDGPTGSGSGGRFDPQKLLRPLFFFRPTSVVQPLKAPDRTLVKRRSVYFPRNKSLLIGVAILLNGTLQTRLYMRCT